MRILNQHRAFLLALFTYLSGVLPQAPGTCYYPKGEIADGYFACDSTAYLIQCCPNGWTCFSNSLCVVTDPATANSSHPIGTTIRSACTHPAWDNGICGNFCLAPDETLGAMTPCGNNTYCCAEDSAPAGECDCSAAALVTVDPGVVQTIVGVTGLAYTATTPGGPAPLAAPTGTQTTPGAAASAPGAATTSETTAPTASTAPTAKSSGSRPMLRVVLPAVLVSVFALALIGLALRYACVLQQRRRRARGSGGPAGSGGIKGRVAGPLGGMVAAGDDDHLRILRPFGPEDPADAAANPYRAARGPVADDEPETVGLEEGNPYRDGAPSAGKGGILGGGSGVDGV